MTEIVIAPFAPERRREVIDFALRARTGVCDKTAEKAQRPRTSSQDLRGRCLSPLDHRAVMRKGISYFDSISEDWPHRVPSLPGA